MLVIGNGSLSFAKSFDKNFNQPHEPNIELFTDKALAVYTQMGLPAKWAGVKSRRLCQTLGKFFQFVCCACACGNSGSYKQQGGTFIVAPRPSRSGYYTAGDDGKSAEPATEYECYYAHREENAGNYTEDEDVLKQLEAAVKEFVASGGQLSTGARAAASSSSSTAEAVASSSAAASSSADGDVVEINPPNNA